MRVLLLTADYPPDTWSGIGHAVARQARALALSGVDVHVLCSTAGEGNPAAGTDGLTVHRLDRRRCPVDPAQFDLVHLHSLSLSELALEMRRRFDLPLVYTAHSLLWRELADGGAPVQRQGWERMQRLLLIAGDAVIFLSRDERRTALHRLPALAARSRVIPNGIEPVSREVPYDTEGPILFAGRFSRSKGMDLLAEIVPAVVERWGIPFVLAGGHGDGVGDRVVAHLRNAVPTRFLQVLPWQSWPQMRVLLQRARLLLVPSRYEPFGQTALEAMAHGTPVLASATGGPTDLITPGSGGLLVHAHEPAAWIDQIGTLLDHPERLRTLSQQGPPATAARFDIRHVAQRLVAEAYANVECRQIQPSAKTFAIGTHR